jgi:hypothetical protein
MTYVYSSVLEIEGQLFRSSSYNDSRPSLNTLRHSNTLILGKYSSMSELLNISNVSVAVLFFTQNLIAALCSNLKTTTRRKKLTFPKQF